MPLLIDNFNKLVKITSPTTDVDAQTLADFIEDFMVTPVGLLTDGTWPGFAGQGDIQDPQGKIEDPSQPGVFSQIILKIHPQWQIQFWGGSGYTRIFGGKLVGGVADEPMKATGTAGDITVLESPVDGLVVATGSGVTQQDKDDIEAQIFAHVQEGSETFEMAMRLIRADAAGRIIQQADGSYVIQDAADSKARVTGDDAANGGRDISAVDGT